MSDQSYHGVLPAMQVPFKPDYTIDEPELRRFSAWLAGTRGITGLVTNIEYRGSSVKLSVNGAGIEDFTAIVADSDFFAKPVSVGEAVPLFWEANDAIVLGRLDS